MSQELIFNGPRRVAAGVDPSSVPDSEVRTSRQLATDLWLALLSLAADGHVSRTAVMSAVFNVLKRALRQLPPADEMEAWRQILDQIHQEYRPWH